MVILKILFIIAAAIMPALIWLIFFLEEDTHKEPASLVAKTFYLGALSSAPALAIQLASNTLFGDGFSFGLLLFAGSEEIFKWLAAYSVISRNAEHDQPMDHMIYMVVAGLGFATIENLFVVSAIMSAEGFSGAVTAAQTIFLRLVGATLLHTLASAIVGYYWSKGDTKTTPGRYVLIGIVTATIVHATFNYLVKTYQDINPLYPTVFLVAVAFFVLVDFEKLKGAVV